MDEEVINDLYERAKSKGYTKSRDEFVNLLHTDSSVLNDMYSYVKSKGYNKDINSFSSLVGSNKTTSPEPVVKKKDSSVSTKSQELQAGTMVSPSGDGFSATQLPQTPRAYKRIRESLSLINEDLMNDTEGNVVEKLSKDQTLKDLGFSFEESTWYGDYVTVTAPDGKTKKEFSLDNFLNSKSAEQSVELQNFIKQNTPRSRREDLEQIAQIEESDIKNIEANKKKFSEEFDQGLAKGFDKNNNKYLNDRLKTIDSKLINQNEEFVVPQMNYQFGDLGFKFEESGMTGDWMTVTAPDGKTQIEISLDPFMDSKAVAESARLQQFIKKYTPNKGLYVVEKSATEGNQKINNQKQVDASIQKVADEANALNINLKEFLSKKSKFDKMQPGTEEYNVLQSELILDRDELMKKQETIKTKEILLKKSLGKYSEMKSQQGTYLAGTWNAFLDSWASVTAGTSDYIIDAWMEMTPNEMQMSPKDLKNESVGIAKKLGIKGPSEKQTFVQWKATLTEDQQDDVEDELDDIAKKYIKKDIIPAIRKGNRELYGSSTATPEWEQLKSENFWGGAYFGLVKTVPALMGGSGPAGWAQRTASMYAMVSDGVRQEMEKNPEFENVSENEKLAVILPIGITGAVLEEFGLKNIKGSTGLINKIAMKALGKTATGATAKTFRELVENEVESALAKGLLITTSSGLAEAESGAAQEATETGIKAIYNEIKGKKMFETPETAGQWVDNIVKAGAQEAIGGIVLGMPTSISVAYSEKGFLKMNDQTFSLFESAANDDNIQKAFITSLKTKITQGIITAADAKEQLNNYRNSVGLFRSLPEGLDIRQKKEAMNLLKEKRDLENFVNGKDPALVVKAKSRIEEINNSLTTLSEQPSAEYIIDDKQYTKDEFLNELKDKTQEELKAMKIVVNNDQETMNSINEKFKTNAVQEQTTDESVLRTEQPEVGLQEVGEGDAQGEVVTEQATQEVTPSETITTAQEVAVPDQHREEYDRLIKEYEKDIADSKENLKSEKERSFFSRSRSYIKDNENNIKFSENQIKLLKENPIEFYKNWIKSEEENHNESLKDKSKDDNGKTYKERVIENYGTTDFNVVEASFIEDINRRISDYEAAQKTANENPQIKTEETKPIELSVTPEVAPEQVSEEVNNKILELENQRDAEIEALKAKRQYDEKYIKPIREKYEALILDEKAKEQAPAETTAETAPVEEKFIIDGKEYTKEEALDKVRYRSSITYGSKMEYNGNDAQAKEFVDRYNEESSPYFRNGRLKGGYIKQELLKAMNNMSFRKFGNLYRKHIDPDFSRASNEKSVGGSVSKDMPFEELAGYIIGDSNPDTFEEKDFRAFAKEAGIDIPEFQTTEAKTEVAPVEKSPIEIQESRVKSAQSLLDEAKTKAAKKKAMTDLVAEQGRLAEMKANEKVKAEVTPETKAEVAPKAKPAEVAPVEELNDLLNVDTKEEGGLKKVYDFLDSLDTALDLDPNELNDVTRVMAIATAKAVVKTLKALVKAGMTLQEAIKQVASDQNLKVRDVVKGINALSEITKIAPGYNALMEKADALIARQKAKGIAEKKILSNLDTMIRKSPIYTDPNTTDAQRKIMEREARAKMGVAPKKSVSIGRVIGALNDIRNVSRAEKLKIISRIKELSKDAAKDLVEEIRELAKKGNITTTQAVNIISRFGKVNMLNEASVSNFVDYMTKVFADAEYDNKIKVAKGKLKNARKSIATKIGIADGLVGPLQKLFSINPELIPESYLEKYLELVDMFGARQAVLNLEEKSKVTKDVIEILNEINNERSAVDELSERLNYSDNKVIEDGKLNYAATVKNMLKEGEITEEEAALMTKYKSEIVPQTEKSSLSEEELQQEKDDLVEEVKKSTINADDLPTRTERDAAKKLAELLKSPAIKELSNTQLKNLLKVIDNINNGYFPHFAHLITEEINSINNSKALASSVNKAKPLPLSKLYAKAKSILTRKDAILEMIRRNPLFNIDQVFGDFKTKDIFNSILGKASEAEAKFTSELKAIQSKLSIAEEKIAKSFTFKDKLNANKVLMSKFKMMTYMVQLEYNSNPDSKQVNPAAKFIEATINHINEGKSQFGEKDAEMLQEILDKYGKVVGKDSKGNDIIDIDIDKIYNSFNSAEKAGIKTIQEINQSLKEKAEYTASVIRGQRINPLSNYIHLNVLSDTKPNDLASGESFADQYNNSLKPSTKAKSLIERTGKVSPLNFDVFASAQKGAKFVLMDFHLTEPIRTARKTINKTIAALGKIDKDKRRIINAINNSFEEAVENLVKNSYMETSAGDDVVNYISKQGYRSVLAGTGRFVAEFLSNAGFVIISDPTTFAEGLKHTAILMSSDAPSIMNNVNSKETNRIFPSDTLSGRLIDTNILSQASGIKGGKAKNKIINRVQQIWNRTGKRYKNAVELTADVLITTPDKAIMRPIWFGSFAANFKKQTGKDVDFKKIAANDETYMNENKEAIEKAKNAADERSVITGASNNSFTGILKGTSKPNQSNFIKGFNNFNNFMTRFLIYEYTSARTGIYAAMGNGSLSRRQGIALLGAVTTRMTVYSLLSKALGSGLIGLLFGSDDDEEEEKKSLDKSIGQALTSTFTSLLFNRDFGNATKMIINEGVEKINENYLQELREGDYDPYEDALQYRVVPVEKKGGQTGVYDFIANMSGSYGPAIKTTNLIIKTYREGDKKEADAIQRQEDVKNIRIPLEVLGNAGFIPLYKDIRKEVMKEIYKDINKPDESVTGYKNYKKYQEKKVVLDSIINASYNQDIIDAAEQKKKDLQYAGTDYQKAMNKKEEIKKKELLFDPETDTQYDNQEDLKKYNKSLWNKNFGPNSDWEQEHKYEDAVDKMVTDALTKKEEEEYNYVKPEKKKKTNSDGTRKRSR